MLSIVDFTNNNNWQKVYEENRQAVRFSSYQYFAIPTFEIGWLFDNQIIAVGAYSDTAKPTWRYAGTLFQSMQLGAGGAASALPIADLLVKRLNLNRVSLIQFNYFSDYRLSFTAPHWIETIDLVFWVYLGISSDNITESLNEARQDLAQIEQKIDNLNTP